MEWTGKVKNHQYIQVNCLKSQCTLITGSWIALTGLVSVSEACDTWSRYNIHFQNLSSLSLMPFQNHDVSGLPTCPAQQGITLSKK